MPGEIHFEYVEIDPSEIELGSWCMFLPLGLAEEVYENPPMVQIEAVRFENNLWTIQTTGGVMFRKPGEKVQVID